MTASPSAVLCSTEGAIIPLLVDRWKAVPTAEELVVLDRAIGPVLDVGCGPGRHVAALATRGLVALGIDVSAEATALARRLGSTVLRRSVFDRLPNEGRWRTALLFDGNIGIGGDAVALLSRLRDVVSNGGSVLVELEAPGAPTRVDNVRVERGAAVGPWFSWAHVGIEGLEDHAIQAGLRVAERWDDGGRPFARLSR